MKSLKTNDDPSGRDWWIEEDWLGWVMKERFAEHTESVAFVRGGWIHTKRGALISPKQTKALARKAERWC